MSNNFFIGDEIDLDNNNSIFNRIVLKSTSSLIRVMYWYKKLKNTSIILHDPLYLYICDQTNGGFIQIND